MIKNIDVKNKIASDKHYKIEAFRKDVRSTKPHKHHQYFEIVYLSKGNGWHWIDSQQYKVSPPLLFFLNRDQIHNWELTEEPEGYVIILKESFLQGSKDESLKQLIHHIWQADCLYLDDKSQIESLFKLLVLENEKNDIYSIHVRDGILKALVANILQIGKSHILHSGLQTVLFSKYLDLLSTQAVVQRQVSYFAKQLNTSPQNLNAACRKAGNMSASQLLTEHILNEAKRLLLYTDNDISEIAYRLNFRDPSYFGKYFKKHLNKTPESFRKLNFQNHHLLG